MEDIIDTSKYARLEELNELEKELVAKAAKCASAASGASVPSNCEHKAEYEAFCSDRLGKLTAQDWIYIVEFPELQMLNENLAEYLGKMDLQSLSADDTVMLVNERPDFADKCPLSVVQNNWYYDEDLDGFDTDKMKADCLSRKILDLYRRLDKRGFDQVPCSSNWCSPKRVKAGRNNDECMGELVKFCRANVAPEHLKGFMMAPWTNCASNGGPLTRNLQGIEQLAAALRYEG